MTALPSTCKFCCVLSNALNNAPWSTVSVPSICAFPSTLISCEKVIVPAAVSATSDLKNWLPCKPSTVSASSPLPGPSSAVVRIRLLSIVVVARPVKSVPVLVNASFLLPAYLISIPPVPSKNLISLSC